MTQEEKNLLLKDIFARLPYDLIVQETFQEAKGNRHVWDCGPHYIKGHPEKVKPYLRPLSSMTEEEKLMFEGLMIGTNNVSYMLDVIDWLNANYFDYRGLIQKGLALEAPEGMYNF